MTKDDNHWRIDRRIPIVVIISLVMQAIGAIVWATELDARVNNIEQQSINGAIANDKFARLEERLESLKENIYAIRRQLDQFTDSRIKK